MGAKTLPSIIKLMAKKFNINLCDKRHYDNIVKRMQGIKDMFDEAVKSASRIGGASGFNDPDNPFYFSNYPAINKKIDELITQLHDKVVFDIEEGDREEWLLSCEKNNELVDAITRSTNIPKAKISQWKQPNLEALEAFQTRKINGMGLSGRVWNITEQLKQELELALDIGLGDGRSAADLTSDVRRYLNEPGRLFRRVRDKHGVLRLSKAAKAYHPGRGVYRSSYKNALRLTATENNIAYRTADHERWQQLPFVIGIEIKLSNNHTLNGHPFYDICDELKGKYPKDFKFTGWHPFCRCFAVPFLAKQDEFLEYQRRMLAGEDVSGFKFTGTVNDVPDNFKSWLDNNEKRLDNAKSIPYYLKDNPKYSGVVAPRIGAGSRYSGTKLGRSATKAAYKNYEDALPPTLSVEQTKNINEIAKDMGISVTPMSFLDADSGKGNIHFGKGTLYEENCQCCVAIHEARLRGLNLTAVAYNADINSVQRQLGEHFEDIWINPNTKKKPVVQKINGSDDNAILRNLEKHMKSSGRYHIGVNYLNGRGHAITAERLDSGKIIYYDAQSGEFINIKEYVALEYMELLKVDKLLFNKSMLRAISELLQ
jgi:hypothetical protein